MNPELIKPTEGPTPVPMYVDPSQHTDGTISAKLLLYAIFKRKWQILGVVAVVVLSIVVAGLIRPSMYKSSAKVIIRPSRAEIQVSAGDQRELTVPVSATTEMVNSEMEILQSNELLRQVIDRMEKAGAPIFGADTTLVLGEQVGALRRMLSVAPAPQSNVIAIDVVARDPERGQAILRTLVNAYLERHATLHGTTGASAFFEEQKGLLRTRVVESEARLNTFIAREGLVLPEDQIRTVLKDAVRGKDSYVVQMAKIRGLERRVTTLREQLATEPKTIQKEIERVNPTGQGLGFELVKKEAERANLMQTYTPDDRLIADLEGEIASLKQRIAETDGKYIVGSERLAANPVRQDLERRLLNSQMNLDDLRARAEGLQDRIDRQSDASSKLAVELRQKSIVLSGLEQDVAAAREAFLLYQKKQEEARIAEALDKERFLNVNVLDDATLASKPFNGMNPLMVLAALIVGGGLGVGSAVGLELLGRNFKFEEQVEQYLDIPVFAVIPDLSEITESQHS